MRIAGKSTVKMVYPCVHIQGPLELNSMFEIYKPNRPLRTEKVVVRLASNKEIPCILCQPILSAISHIVS